MGDAPRAGRKTAPDPAGSIGASAARKLRARRQPAPDVWFGLGMMGLVGWSVVVPTLLGAAIGLWLDRRYPGSRSWTLALLVTGLAIGCANAWRWVTGAEAGMRSEPEDGDE